VTLAPRALRGVAEALRLTPAQREYVFALARGETLGVEPPASSTVSPTLQVVDEHAALFMIVYTPAPATDAASKLAKLASRRPAG
jgi:hypothetical protein